VDGAKQVSGQATRLMRSLPPVTIFSPADPRRVSRRCWLAPRQPGLAIAVLQTPPSDDRRF